MSAASRRARLALALVVGLGAGSAQGQVAARHDSALVAGGGGGVPAIVSQGRIDPRVDVNFSALVTPTSVYVGQQATYQIGVFLSEDVRQRLRRNPEFVPPDVRSMVTYDLPAPARPLLRSEAGREYDVHVFQRALFPLTAGTHVIAPARLSYALPLSSSFFSREENHSARTLGFTIVARDPPTAGRPAGWEGAVGRLQMKARVDTSRTRVGDPLTLTVTVSGVGNVSLLPRPALAVPWAETVNGAERVTIDTTSPLVQGRKDFEWVVTPRREGSVEIPEVRYPYWNPYTERYEVALSRAIPLRVAPGTLAAAPTMGADAEPRLPLRARYRGALSRPLPASPVFWLGLAAVPLPALALGIAARPRRRRRVAPIDAVARFAAGAEHSAAELRRAFAGAIAERTGVGAATMTDGRAFVRALRRTGVTDEGARRAQLLLAELDRAVYGGEGAPAAPDMAARALATLRVIDEEAKPGAPPGRHLAGAALALSFSLGMAAAVHAADAFDEQRFGRGVRFYEQGFYDASMREFSDLARRVPRAADAWANLGTAAWEASDTATAVIGWQRALRLEPLADDVRGRLEQTPGFRAGLTGDVPPVPTDAAALLGALLWVGGWAGLAHGFRSRTAAVRRPSLAALTASVVVALATVALDDLSTGRSRVVIVAPEPLRAVAALAADRVGDVVAGETARIEGEQGVWTRLQLPDGRSGWIESRRVASLDVGRAP